MVVSGLLSVAMAAVHTPLEFFGMIFVGRIATAGILGLALAYILIGYGLLRLKPQARTAGIIFCALLGLSALGSALVPGTHSRLLAAMKNTNFFARRVEHQSPASAPFAFSLLLVPVIGTPLWFLVTRKQAFKYSAAPGTSPRA